MWSERLASIGRDILWPRIEVCAMQECCCDRKVRSAQSFTLWMQAIISRHWYMGVVFRAHPVRGESHIKRNVNREVVTVPSLCTSEKIATVLSSAVICGKFWENAPSFVFFNVSVIQRNNGHVDVTLSVASIQLHLQHCCHGNVASLYCGTTSQKLSGSTGLSISAFGAEWLETLIARHHFPSNFFWFRSFLLIFEQNQQHGRSMSKNKRGRSRGSERWSRGAVDWTSDAIIKGCWQEVKK